MGLEVGIALVSLVVGVSQAKKADERAAAATAQQEEAMRKQTAAEKVKESQSRRQQIREARRRQAQILQRAESLGVSGSSGEAGATGAVATTVGSNIGSQRGETLSSESVSRSLQASRDEAASAENFAARSSLSLDIFRSSGGFETLFKNSK